MVRRRGRTSPSWRSFLRNQAAGIAAIDMFIVASVSFRLQYVMIILAHDRRRILHAAVTEHPTALWLSRQITAAFPWDTAPRYLLRNRDASDGAEFCKTNTCAVAGGDQACYSETSGAAAARLPAIRCGSTKN
jgi:hypothetical protein